MKVNQNAVNAVESATTESIEQALESGFLPEDETYRTTGKFADGKGPARVENKDQEKETPTEVDGAAATEDKTAATNENGDAADSQSANKDQSKETPEEQEEEPETGNRSENRYRKLARENRELREQLARQQGREEGRQSVTDASKPNSRTATDKNAAPAEPQIDDVDDKGKPKFANYQEFDRAHRGWMLDEATRRAQQTVTQTQEQQRMAEAQRIVVEGMQKKFEAARKVHKDFDQVALNPDLRIPPGSVADGFLLDSEHAGEVAYHLGQHPELLESFYSAPDAQGRFRNLITPQQQFRKLLAIEAKFSGTKNETPSTEKPITRAPKPATQVNGTATVTKSADKQAVDDGDTETYMRDVNSRDPRLAAVRASRKKG